MRLSDLSIGTSAIVTQVLGTSRIASRLMELGLVPGAVVQVLRRAPFGGPVQYRVCGSSLTMRAAEAACVGVSVRTADAGVSVPAFALAAS